MSAIAPSPAPVEAQLERQLYVLINQDRSERGLPPLVVDDRLGEVAREQSRLMAIRGCLSHNLEPSGGLVTRLGRAGYRFRAARENLALAGSVEQARDALLKSPTHLANLLATDITHLGVGVVRGAFPGDRELYVTQIFTQPATAPAARRADSGFPLLSASR